MSHHIPAEPILPPNFQEPIMKPIKQLFDEATAEGTDAYEHIAMEMWGEVTPTTRRDAAALCFAFLYGGDEFPGTKPYVNGSVCIYDKQWAEIGHEALEMRVADAMSDDPSPPPNYQQAMLDRFDDYDECPFMDMPDPNLGKTVPLLGQISDPSKLAPIKFYPTPHQRPMTYAAKKQAEDRVHRVGKKRYKVHVDPGNGGSPSDYVVFADSALEARCMAFASSCGCEPGPGWLEGYEDLAHKYTWLLEGTYDV